MQDANALDLAAIAQEQITGGDREPSEVGRLPGVP
jgi:hypothetical protein